MSDIKERLREAVQKLRRTPMAIAYISPMLTDAADHIATLEQESAANLQRALAAEKDAARYRYLRDEGDGFTIDVREQDIDGENWVTGYAAQELDEAIDAARAPDTSTQEVG